MERRKKGSRMRGHRTHGWGSKKKRRGFGSRGGKGRAGSGKRSDTKKPSVWTNTVYFGKRGFNPHTRRTGASINVAALCERIDALVESGIAVSESNGYTVNLAAAGYTKLLGKGACTHKLSVTVPKATEKATAKIEAAGGSVTTE